jgi:hypothetical protein
MQIIQSGPSTATIRQQALNNALATAIDGYADYEKQQKQDALTKRQEALQLKAQEREDLKSKIAFEQNAAEKGMDISYEDAVAHANGTYKPKEISPAQEAVTAQYGKELQGPVMPGQGSLKELLSPAKEAKAAVMGPANPYQNYTESKKAEIEQKKKIADMDFQNKVLSNQKLQGDVQFQPYEQQKKLEEIKKIQEDNKMRPVEKAAKLADIEWKHSQATEKMDEKTNRRFSDFAKQVANPTTRNALGNFGKNLASADRIKVLTDSFTSGLKPGSPEEIAALNRLTSTQSEEVTKSLDSLLSGGQSTISGADHLRFTTMQSKWADLKAKYGGSPQGAELGEFLSQALETVNRERDYNQKQVERILGGMGEGYSDLRKKDQNRFNSILGSAYQPGEVEHQTALTVPAPGADPAFEAWKKAKGH